MEFVYALSERLEKKKKRPKKRTGGIRPGRATKKVGDGRERESRGES